MLLACRRHRFTSPRRELTHVNLAGCPQTGVCCQYGVKPFRYCSHRAEQFADGNADWRSGRVRGVWVRRAIAQSLGDFAIGDEAVPMVRKIDRRHMAVGHHLAKRLPWPPRSPLHRLTQPTHPAAVPEEPPAAFNATPNRCSRHPTNKSALLPAPNGPHQGPFGTPDSGQPPLSIAQARNSSARLVTNSRG